MLHRISVIESADTIGQDIQDARRMIDVTNLSVIDLIEPLQSELVPPEQQKLLLERAHSMGHFGATSMFKALTKQNHTWKTMRQDCITTVQGCLPCQRFNIGKHGFHPLSSIIANLPWDHIGFDLKQFICSKRGFVYMLVVVDVCTRFVFLRALKNKDMHTVALTLLEIFCDVGFPKIVQSDRGTEFCNQVLDCIVETANID